MRDTLGESLRRLKWIKVRKIRMFAVLLALSLVVSLDVFWALRQPGLTLAGDASCGIEEHTHDDDCGRKVCVCPLPEEAHIHDDSCYLIQLAEAKEEHRLVCQQTEEPHLHGDSCYETVMMEPIIESVLVCEGESETHFHEIGCYEMRQIGTREENLLICNLISEPHQHIEGCFAVEITEPVEERILICGLSEETHIHEDACYEWELTCEKAEHIHSLACYSDQSADVETMLDWQQMFEDYPYTGDLRRDLVGIAQTQVGYAESALNFAVGPDGIRRGYTRYGAWYGTPYNDWSAMFVSFCLSYAGADPAEAPGNIGAASMMEIWKHLDKYAPVGEYDPAIGDLVFFEDNTVGIVAEVYNATICVIRGDVNDAVCSEVLPLADETIIGWGSTVGTVPAEETESEEELEKDLLDISDGPAVFIFAGEGAQAAMQRYSLRNTRAIIDLLPYLGANGGGYFFTLLDFNNVELPKDAEGNYIAEAAEKYKLTVTFNSPNGFAPGTYQYQVPNGLLVDGGQGEFVLQDDTNVGSWTVTDTGLITLVFNEQINSRTDITISMALGIHFPEQEEPIDFDGKISVSIEKPPPQSNPTVVNKWGNQGGTPGSDGDDPNKIYWGIEVIGNKDSKIPGSILTDQIIDGEWSKIHRYTASDIAGGLSIGVSENGNWHTWEVAADDPHLIWTETGWTYKMPQTATCQWCGELELGNEGWYYYIKYTSTPDPAGTAGTFGYENDATIDGAYGYAWINFTHGEATGEIIKNGSFASDAGGGAFLWEFEATVPGRPVGERAKYHWYIMDNMRLLDSGGQVAGLIENDAHLATVAATYNGTTVLIPRIQDATDADLFAWDNGWSATENGINHGREFSILCRCQCTPDTCHWGANCGEYWYKVDGVPYSTTDFCQCWTLTENVTFTFVYKTNAVPLVDNYGGLGYQVQNVAELFYIPEGASGGASVSRSEAIVPIPGVFKKELTHDFDGYTANYKITVNEAKLVLTNGTPLYIHDVMTSTLAYISGSLVVTAEDADGNTTILRQGTDYTVAYDGTGKQTDAQGNAAHVLDIVIRHPQPVMYTLDYDATIIIPEQVTEGIRYGNSASVTLWGEKVSDDSVQKVYADIVIAAKNYTVEMLKTSAVTGEPLAGATFGFYNEQGGLITTDISDENGKMVFQTSITEGIILRDHTLYYLQEQKAPSGYMLDDTKHWFCFCNQPDDSCEICQELLAQTQGTRIPYDQVGQLHAINEMIYYDLPATGGCGIYPLVIASVMMIVTPLLYAFIQRRKQERRGAG